MITITIQIEEIGNQSVQLHVNTPESKATETERLMANVLGDAIRQAIDFSEGKKISGPEFS